MARVVLVTGGMHGLTMAICIRMHALGYRVVASRSTEDGRMEEAPVQTIKIGNDELAVYPCDASDRDSAQQCVAHIETEVGPIDVLVNAGITRGMAGTNRPQSDTHAAGPINANSIIDMTRLIYDGMILRGWGRIINIAAADDREAVSTLTNHAVAHSGLHHFMQALTPDAARGAVTVNTISPGYIGTMATMASRSKQGTTMQMSEGKAEEIAGLVAYLASDEAAYVTGANLVINGGRHMN